MAEISDSTTSTAPTADIQADAEIDSVYAESERTDTTSLRSWILDYRVENNRTYHAYGQHEYWGANDAEALEHMEIGHALFTRTFGGRLFLAPIEPDPQNILDIGTGTGSWAIDVADEYPSALVIGTDLSPIQPSWVPPNCKFQIDDCEADFCWPENRFDYIHIRCLHGTIRNWPRLYQQCLRVLRPGGYIEQAEHSAQFTSEDGTTLPDGGIVAWNKVGVECHQKLGTELQVFETMADKMRSAGFESVTETHFRWPTGRWPKNPEMKNIGRLAYHFIDTGAENWTLRLLTSVLGWTAEEVYLLCANLREELRNPKVHAIWQMRVAYARKPQS